MSSAQSSQPAQQQSAQEVLQSLRATHLERVRVLSDLKDQYIELQKQLLAAQEGVYKSYQAFSVASEQYMVSVIDAQSNQLRAAQPQQAARLETVQEVREDNLSAPDEPSQVPQ
jgi:hypothetical protein